MDKVWIARVLVALQFAICTAMVLTASPSIGYVAGWLIAVTGGLLGLWAVITLGLRRISIMPEVKHGAELVTSGPYQLVRHPMYSALLLAMGGLMFCPFAAWKLVFWCILLFVLLAKIRIEERGLLAAFDGYADYARRTKRLVPYLL